MAYVYHYNGKTPEAMRRNDYNELRPYIRADYVVECPVYTSEEISEKLADAMGACEVMAPGEVYEGEFFTISRTLTLHARVTKEIEVMPEQAERLYNRLTGCIENANIDDIKEMFTDGVNSGNYEAGYIPAEWAIADLETGVFDNIADECVRFDDIDLEVCV